MRYFLAIAVLFVAGAAAQKVHKAPMKMPRIGLGCFDPQQGDAGIHLPSGVAGYNASQTAPATYPVGAKIRQLAYEALIRGYRSFDGAEEYGNDPAIGEALKQAVAEGFVTRNNVFLTSKLANARMGPDDVEPNLRQTNYNFGVDKIDLYLIHHPYAMTYQRKDFIQTIDYLDVWKYMIKAYQKGLARHIGVANFNASMLQRCIDESEMAPHAIQLETHPYQPNNDVLEICKKHNITLIAYAPLGTPWHARETNRTPMLEDPLFKELGQKYKLTPAQVVFNWHLQRSHLTSVVPHTENYVHLDENIKTPAVKLSKKDMERINALARPGLEGRFWQFIDHRPAKYFPYELE